LDPLGTVTHEPLEPNASCSWVEWTAATADEVNGRVYEFEALDTDAGLAATEWLQRDAFGDSFTKTRLLLSEQRLEGFITCRVSEATLTWSGARVLNVPRRRFRKRVPAYLLCWCAKNREAEIDGEELILNAIRLAREVQQRHGCSVLVVDPRDEVSAEKVWKQKYGFREGANPEEGKPPRLWLPLSAG
jgi:hypothetical protein